MTGITARVDVADELLPEDFSIDIVLRHDRSFPALQCSRGGSWTAPWNDRFDFGPDCAVPLFCRIAARREKNSSR
jgi:hypothetical protein